MYYKYVHNVGGTSNEIKLFFIVFIIACVALGLAFLNAVGSFLRLKSVNFIFGFLWVAIFFLLVVFVAFLFKDVLNFSTDKPLKSENIAYLAHEDDYSNSCLNKYNPESKLADKNLVYRWEAQPVVGTYLNANCNAVANDVAIWHYYIFAIWAAFLFGSVAVAAAANFALAISDKDEESYKSFHIFDLISVVVIVLLGIALGLYLIFRPAPEPVSRFTDSNSLYALDTNGNVIANPTFKHLLEGTLGKHFAGIMKGFQRSN